MAIPAGYETLWQGAFMDGVLRYFWKPNHTVPTQKVFFVFIGADLELSGELQFDSTRVNMDKFVDACNEHIEQLYYQSCTQYIRNNPTELN